jgi:hypothetical protein
MKYLHFILIVFFISSCGIYKQNVINVPAFEHKGQLQIGVHQSFNGSEAQASLSVTNNIGIMANYCDMGERRNDYSSFNFSIDKHHFSEIGIGLFKKKTKESKTIKELFLIGGKGFTSNYVESYGKGITEIQYKEATYSRLTLQGDYGVKENNFSILFSPRIFLINYYNIIDTSVSAYRQTPNSFIRLEVATTIRYHFNKYIALSGQMCITIPEYSYLVSDKLYDEFSVYNFSIGLIGNINFIKPKD